MKNKLLWLLLCLCVWCAEGRAQQSFSSYTVKGMLLDSLTQEGEPYATIRIVRKEAPKQVVKMAVTKGDGMFLEKMQAKPGRYVLTISSIGRAPIVKEFSVFPSKRIIDFGILLSREATNELAAVEVVAQKPLVKVNVDKIEYNLSDDPDSKSNSVLEMLRKVPMVTVDGEDNIQVNGSSSFQIHVNGKPNTLMSNNPKEVLQSMPANAIKHIEVITSPGAKYDAEGVGGILNIVTMGTNMEGFTATIKGNVSNSRAGGDTYVMLQKGKLTFSLNYNYSQQFSPRSYADSYRENLAEEQTDERFLESHKSTKTRGNFQYGNMEASYEIDSLRLLSAAVGLYGSKDDTESDGRTVMYGDNHQDVAYQYRTLNSGKSSWFSVDGNIDYQRTSRKNKQRLLTLSYKIHTQPYTTDAYQRYLDMEPADQREELVERLLLQDSQSDGHTNTMEQTFQTDFTTPLGKWHTLDVGLKYIFRRNSSDNCFYDAAAGSEDFVYNDRRSSEYRHLNHILSAYWGYTLKYKQFSFKPGVRYEQTIQRVKYLVGPGENFHTDFSDWVPSLTLGMKIKEMQNLRLSYNMRILRPSIRNLNPYFDNLNPMMITQGNPDLESEKSHTFDLAYSNFTSKFNMNVSLRHSFNNNGIERYSRLITAKEGEIFDGDPTHVAPNGALYTTYGNIAKSRETGMTLYFNWNLTPTTRIHVNGRGNYKDLRSEEQGLHNHGWSASVHGGIQQTLPYKIRLSLNGGGSTPRLSLQGKSTGYRFYSITLNRSFLKEDRLTVNVYCNNVFEKYRTFTTQTHGANFWSKNESKYPTRRVGFSVSYRIGDLKAKVKKASRGIHNDDLKGDGGKSGGEGGSDAA